MKALQDVFPIIYQDRLIGLVDRASLIDMATRDPADQYLSSFMAREFVTARADDPLLDTLALANEQRLGSIPITDAEGAFLGLLIPSHVSDFIVVDTIREDQRNFQEQADSDDFV
jgi:predicted transcriptional regulator